MIPLDVMETYVPTCNKTSHFKTTEETGKAFRIRQTKQMKEYSGYFKTAAKSKFLSWQKYPT